MPDRTRKAIEVAAAVVGLVAGLAGLFGAFVLLPSRMEAAEKQILRLNDRDEKAREVLIRIEERLIRVDGQIQEMKGRK